MANTDVMTKASFKSRVLGDFVKSDGISVDASINPQEVQGERRLGMEIKNQGGGIGQFTVTVVKNCSNYVSGLVAYFAEFAAFSDDGDAGTFVLYTTEDNNVTITNAWLAGITLDGVYSGQGDAEDATYIEMTYTFLRSLF